MDTKFLRKIHDRLYKTENNKEYNQRHLDAIASYMRDNSYDYVNMSRITPNGIVGSFTDEAAVKVVYDAEKKAVIAYLSDVAKLISVYYRISESDLTQLVNDNFRLYMSIKHKLATPDSKKMIGDLATKIYHTQLGKTA